MARMTKSATVRAVLADATRRLAGVGVASPRLDAALLLAHVLGLPRYRLSVEPERAVAGAERAVFEGLLAQREQRRPVSQLLGRAEFWSLEFRITADTLAPRPETEMLAEQAIGFLRDAAAPRLIEIGPGSGCISIALAHAAPAARVDAVDISSAALAVARENAARHRVLDRITFHEGDLFAPLAGVIADGSVDVLVSNPPYVQRDERDAVDPEVLFEPEVAVFCDGAPEAVYDRIAREGARYVRPGGLLLLELPGAGSQPVVETVASQTAWGDVHVLPDLAGLPRVLRALREP